MQKVRFVLKGNVYQTDKKTVAAIMKYCRPRPIRKYYVVVNRKRYPIKQVISEVTHFGLSEFGTVDAAPILQRLGFKLRWLT